ncbi:YmfQ family protein [Shinella pollutisoli]|uniref:YmfQ family protein n=1 Tax=Shinella pollutisoli TaxID=2250594 RepID=A0ABV7DIC9_9HYPH|nr:putative phage tail protein [Shinella pollutisoli]
MARDLRTISQSLIRKLPTGFALGRRDGVLDTVLGAAGGLLHDAEGAAERMMDEIDPRTAKALLPDFERVLGPDPCGRDRQTLTIEQRQRLAHQRWTARGGQSIPYMVETASRLGSAITIDEFWPSRAGSMRAGQRLRPEGSQFVWRVNLPGRFTPVKFRAGVGRAGHRLGSSLIGGIGSDFITVTKFRAGVSRAGHRLGTFELSPIECELRRIKPAHTHVVFNYGAP